MNNLFDAINKIKLSRDNLNNLLKEKYNINIKNENFLNYEIIEKPIYYIVDRDAFYFSSDFNLAIRNITNTINHGLYLIEDNSILIHTDYSSMSIEVFTNIIKNLNFNKLLLKITI